MPGAILDTWFGPGRPARIPIFAFNALSPESIKEIVDLVLSRFPHWNVGAVCPARRVHQPLRAADAPGPPRPTSTTSCATPASTCCWSPMTATRSSSTAWPMRATTWSCSTSPPRPRKSWPATSRPGGTLIKLTGQRRAGAAAGAGRGVHPRPAGAVRAGVPARGGAPNRDHELKFPRAERCFHRASADPISVGSGRRGTCVCGDPHSFPQPAPLASVDAPDATASRARSR